MSVLYDPPEGWKYGFPKPWDSSLTCDDNTIIEQLIKDGYPEELARTMYTWVRFIYK